MKYFFIFLVALSVIILYSNKCKNQINNKSEVCTESILIDKDFNYLYNKGSYKIKKIHVQDSILTIVFTANVCANDKVELVYNGMILKSLPPKVQIGIRYNENNKCKDNEVIKNYNISLLKQKNSNKIILLFPDYQPIEYSY